MRRLPLKPNDKQKRIIEAVKDYFGETKKEERQSITKIACWILNRKKGNVLSEDEKNIKDIIKINLRDTTYSKNAPTAI